MSVFIRPEKGYRNIVDRLENGGVIVESTLAEFQLQYQTLFFIGSLIISLASLFSSLYSFFGFRPTNFMNSSFQLLIGVILMLLDTPGQPRWSAKVRSDIRKQARILSKLFGKSLSLLFLSCLTTVTLWPNNKNTKTSGFSIALAFFISLGVALIAIIGLFIAIEKSIKLNKIKKIIISDEAMGSLNVVELYRTYAISDPYFGMTMDEFNKIVIEKSETSESLSPTDLSIIFNALDENQKGAISEKEFVEFINSLFVLV